MKFKVFLSIFILFMGISLISCDGTQEQAEQLEQAEPVPVMDMAQVRQSIEEANVKFGEAARSGDATALASLYAEDARLLPPNSEMIQGREGVEAYWAGGFQMGVKEIVLTTMDVMEMGDLVCEIGKAEVTAQPEGMDAIQDVGKYVVIWKKALDGAWRLYIDIWNTNLPLQ
jgi:uncharacterized protein (TIGR02246 family)